jgi:HlyD family secretion protein
MMHSQRVEIIGKQLFFRQLLVLGAVLFLGGGGAYSLWRWHTTSIQTTQPAAVFRVKTVTPLGYLKLRGEVIRLSARSAQKAAGSTKSASNRRD